jgi:hypothetical protein
MVTGASLKKMSLERLQQKIIEQMHTVNLTGKTDQEIISITTNTTRTVQKWEVTRTKLGLKTLLKTYQRKHPKLELNEDRSRSLEQKGFQRDQLEREKFKRDQSERKSKKDYVKTEAIERSDIDRRKAAGERLRCSWPADRKGSLRVKDCIRPIKLDKGTASYPKAKEYHKMKVAGME